MIKKFIVLFILMISGSIAIYYFLILRKPPAPRIETDAYPELPIQFFSWKEPDLFYQMFPLANYAEKTINSSSGDYIAFVNNNALVIKKTHAVGETKVPFTPGVSDRQYFFLNDEMLVLIEKENTEKGVDNFYIVKIPSGEKLFFTGSFPVPSRLNLDKKVGVYEEGRTLIMADNEGKLWQLDLTY